ncbi:hypothetical protein [Gallibacterium anatis]|uniref:hypothetical protein n=1 Tax=Gallibacterium anatis TaxID=750 RepID=UPI000B007AD7|nr:hypothetical protein [Gallibacterium anatis]
MTFYLNFLFVLTILFFYFVFQTTLIRKYMVKSFIDTDLLQDPQNYRSFSRMWRMGYRYDAKISAIIIAIPFIIGSVLIAFSLYQATISLFSFYIFLISLLFTGINIGNYFYFKTYKSYYNIFMFGIVEDDTKAVLNNIWEDYPIIKLLVLTILAAIFPTSIFIYILSQQPLVIENYSTLITITFGLISLIYLAYAARGYFFTHPLAKMHAQVSSLSIINQMVPNGIIAMKWAFEDRKRDIQFSAVDKKQGSKLIKQFTKIIPTTQCFEYENPQQFFIDKTEKNTFLQQNPPHIVI